jgi:hypothetical protein
MDKPTMFNPNAHADVDLAAAVVARGGIGLPVKAENHWRWECRDKHGKLKWVEEYDNLVTTAGLNDIINQYFKGSAYTAAWYIGLISASPTVNAADTLASHSGWTEVTAYDESVRQTLTLGTASGGSASNTASKARFTISTDGTAFGGGFLATNSTKGGTTGTLYGVGAFGGGDKTLSDGDTVDVTVTPSFT